MTRKFKLFVFIFVTINFLFTISDTHAVVILQEENDSAESEAKKELSITISYFNTNDSARVVNVKLATSMITEDGGKKRKRWIPVKDVIVNLYLNEITKEGMLGSLATDNKGMAVFPLVNKFKTAKDTTNNFKFIARIMGDMNYEDSEGEIEITESRIEFSTTIEDSVRYLNAKVLKPDETGEFVPVEGAELNFYVKRDYGYLPLSESNISTDESGEAILEFPHIIPGDDKGGITIVARVVDNEELGLVESYLTEQWGTPTIITLHNERALWASRMNAPVWVILLVNLILLGIWLTIMYIFYQLYIIKKIGSNDLIIK